jgi:hypothetical protein
MFFRGRNECAVSTDHTPDSDMNRARGLARHLFVEIPYIWWDFFIDMWRQMFEALCPPSFHDRDGDYPDQCEPFVDWGGGD